MSGAGTGRTRALVVGVALLVAVPALARERLAVAIVVDDDAPVARPGLASDLEEVAIARLADVSDSDLVGTRELRRSLADVIGPEGLGACLALAPCLAKIGVAAAVQRAIVGRVGRQGAALRVDIAIVETSTSVKRRQVLRQVPVDLDELIAAIQSGVASLIAPPSPLPAARAPAPRAPSSTIIAVGGSGVPAGAHIARGRSWSWAAGYGAAALAVVALSGAAVKGTLAAEPPTGQTRAEIQEDLNRRVGDARIANGLIVTGIVLAAASLGAFLWARHHD